MEHLTFDFYPHFLYTFCIIYGVKLGSIRELKRSCGGTTYHVSVRLKGYPDQCASFRKRVLANRWIQDVESAIRDGRHFKTSESKKHTVSDMIDKFHLRLESFPDSLYTHKCYLKWWKAKLGHLRLFDLTPWILSECIDVLLTTKTRNNKLYNPSTVNRYISAFSKPLTVAVKQWGWIESNPILKTTKPKQGPGRSRLLSLDEKDRLMRGCRKSSNPYLYNIVSLAILTAMRGGEIFNLRYEDCDFENKMITIKKTKNGDSRVIPITQAIEDVLDSCRTNDFDSGLIFKPQSHKNLSGLVVVRDAFKTVLRKEKILDFRFHDLRHAAASYLAMNGATQGELMAILGHRTHKMTQRYTHYSQKHISNLMDRMHNNASYDLKKA